MSDLDRRRFRLERAALWVTALAFVSAATIGVAQAVQADRIYTATNRQLQTAQEQNRISTQSINAARFQSVYERMLDVDKLMAENPEAAGPLLGADEVDGLAVYFLDFYLYAWNNIPFIIEPKLINHPNSLALRDATKPGGLTALPPAGWSPGLWESWVTWSETIASGFRAADHSRPNRLCSALQENRAAFGEHFVGGITEAGLCDPAILPHSP